MALHGGLFSENKDAAADILRMLGSTERNFKLTKGETTVGLEKARLEGQTTKELLEFLKNLGGVLGSRGKD